jgi:methionine synthase II (cobalamin-independent)
LNPQLTSGTTVGRQVAAGSLLRPEKIEGARRRFDNGQISHEHFRTIENEVVLEALAASGGSRTRYVTDGEMRRLKIQDRINRVNLS